MQREHIHSPSGAQESVPDSQVGITVRQSSLHTLLGRKSKTHHFLPGDGWIQIFSTPPSSGLWIPSNTLLFPTNPTLSLVVGGGVRVYIDSWTICKNLTNSGPGQDVMVIFFVFPFETDHRHFIFLLNNQVSPIRLEVRQTDMFIWSLIIN